MFLCLSWRLLFHISLDVDDFTLMLTYNNFMNILLGGLLYSILTHNLKTYLYYIFQLCTTNSRGFFEFVTSMTITVNVGFAISRPHC